MAKKIVNTPFEGHTIKAVYDFNSEDLGLSISNTMSKDTLRGLLKSPSARVILGLGREAGDVLRKKMGASNYNNLISRYLENLSDSLSKRLEVFDSDKCVVKVYMKEDGTTTSWLNGTKIDTGKLPKDMMTETLTTLRDTMLGNDPLRR